MQATAQLAAYTGVPCLLPNHTSKGLHAVSDAATCGCGSCLVTTVLMVALKGTTV